MCDHATYPLPLSWALYCTVHSCGTQFQNSEFNKILFAGHVILESDAQFLNNRLNYPAWSPPMQYPQVPQQRQQYPQQQQQFQQQFPPQQRWFNGPPQQRWLGQQPERTLYQSGWIRVRDMDSIKPASSAAAGYAGGAGQMSER